MILMFLPKLIEYLRLLNRYRVYQRLLKKPCTKHPDGFFYSGRGTTMNSGAREAFETEIFKKILNEIKIFVNIGAHHGYYSCLALSKNIETIAYEPEATNIEMIKKHIAANNFLPAFELHAAAVGSMHGELTLFGGNSGGSLLQSNGHNRAPKAQQQKVKVVTLNKTLDLKNLKSLCLMDIEGFEYEALKGATEILSAENKPYWIVEVWPKDENGAVNPNFAKVFSLMETFGYQAWGIDEHTKRLMDLPLKLAKLVEKGEVEIDFINFLFIQKGDSLLMRLDL